MSRKSFLPWIRVNSDLSEHPKSKRLDARLGVDNAHVYPLNLWCWAAQYALDGIVRGTQTAELMRLVESAARWKGEPGKLFSALLAVGFIDALDKPIRTVVVHNWEKIQGAHRRQTLGNAKRKREWRLKKDGRSEPLFDDENFTSDIAARKRNDPHPVNPQTSEIRPEKEMSRVTERGRHADVPTDTYLRHSASLAPGGSVVRLGGQKKPVVVVGKRRKKSPEKITPTTTATAGRKTGSGDFERDGRELFDRLLVALKQKGKHAIAQQLGDKFWPREFRNNALRLGTVSQYSVNWLTEVAELVILETLLEFGPTCAVYAEVTDQPTRPWDLGECVSALHHLGLSGSATDKNLAIFWEQASEVQAADILEAARLYREDDTFSAKRWPLAIFITEAVWKSRVGGASAIAQQRARL